MLAVFFIHMQDTTNRYSAIDDPAQLEVQHLDEPNNGAETKRQPVGTNEFSLLEALEAHVSFSEWKFRIDMMKLYQTLPLFIPSSKEINLHKQLSIQRLEQQIEMENLQHKQKIEKMNIALAQATAGLPPSTRKMMTKLLYSQQA